MTLSSRRWIAALALAASALAPLPADAGDTLFDRLGQREGLTRIANGTIDRALQDERIALLFDNTNIERLKGLLAIQLCALAGGDCVYKGQSMTASHKHLRLTTGHFNALVEDMQAAMNAEGIGFSTQNRLIAILAPMYREVVNP